MKNTRLAALAAAILTAASYSARADDAPGEPVTFSKHIAPLLQKHCQSCHRPGEAAPMALLDFAATRPWVKSIKKSVIDKTMPPWHADPAHGTFSNDRRMSEEEIATFTRWVDAGAPEGDPKDLPAPLEFVEGWGIGVPDLVLTVPQVVKLPAEGKVPYKHIVMPPFPEDRWVQKIEIRPKNRDAAHHINVFRAMPGQDPKKAREFVTGFVPGGIVTEYPDPTAVFFPKGTQIVLQAHYITNGTEQTDQPSIGFVFARKPIEKEVYNALISNYMFRIPPGNPDYVVEAHWGFSTPVTLIGTMVHMHLRGKNYAYVASLPDGTKQTLMSVPKYDFNWQMGYHFKDRPELPAGTRLTGVAHMDNSPGNPHNPDPTATVKYGSQTEDEMIMGFVFYTKDNEHLAGGTGAVNLGPLSAAGEAALKAPAPVPAPAETGGEDLEGPGSAGL